MEVEGVNNREIGGIHVGGCGRGKQQTGKMNDVEVVISCSDGK